MPKLRTLLILVVLNCCCLYGQWQIVDSPVVGTPVSISKTVDNLYLGFSDNQKFPFWKSSNAGGDWNLPQVDYTAISLCGQSVNSLFAYDSLIIINSTPFGLKSIDAGKTWKPLKGIPGDSIPQILNMNEKKLFVLGATKFYFSSDGGDKWIAIPFDTSLIKSKNIVSAYYKDSVAYINDGTIYTSVNNGKTWLNTMDIEDNFYHTDRFCETTCGTIALGYGNIFMYDTSAKSWDDITPQLLLTSGNAISAVFAKDLRIAVGAEDGTIYLSGDCGTTWTGIKSPYQTQAVSSLFLEGNTIYAGAYYGGFFVSTNLGVTWKCYNNGLQNAPVYSIAMNFGTSVYIGSEGLYKYNPANNTWLKQRSNSSSQDFVPGPVTSVYRIDTTVYAGTIDGVYKKNDNDNLWTQCISSGKINTLIFNGIDLYAGTIGGMFKFTMDCEYDTLKNSGLMPDTITKFNYLDGAGDTLYAATTTGVYYSTDDGNTWNLLGVVHRSFNTLRIDGNRLYAAGKAGYYIYDRIADTTITSSSLINNNIISCMTITNGNCVAGTDNGVFVTPENEINWKDITENLNSYCGSTNILTVFPVGDSIFIGTTSGLFKRYTLDVTDVPNIPNNIKNDISISPNPVRYRAQINYYSDAPGTVTISLFDYFGNKMELQQANQGAGNHNLEFDASTLSSGVYYCMIRTGNKIETGKFVVVK